MLGYIILAISVVVLVGIFVHARKVQRLVVGGLYSVVAGKGQFGVVKLLAFDSKGVHLCLYKNRFRKRPASVDPLLLTIGTIHDDALPGIGHLPIRRKDFFHWFPLYIGEAAVSEEELEGYRMWKEADGGYFDARIMKS